MCVAFSSVVQVFCRQSEGHINQVWSHARIVQDEFPNVGAFSLGRETREKSQICFVDEGIGSCQIVTCGNLCSAEVGVRSTPPKWEI